MPPSRVHSSRVSRQIAQFLELCVYVARVMSGSTLWISKGNNILHIGFNSNLNQSELMCHITNIFPRTVLISLWTRHHLSPYRILTSHFSDTKLTSYYDEYDHPILQATWMLPEAPYFGRHTWFRLDFLISFSMLHRCNTIFIIMGKFHNFGKI